MLIGMYSNVLDASNRLILPREFGEHFEDGIYLTQGFDRNIMILTVAAFHEIYKRITSLNLADPVARLLLRMILGTAYKTEIDPEGAVHISDKLKDFARLKRDVVLVGQGDFVEVWSPEVWDRQEEQLLDANANLNRFSTLTIITK